MMPREIIIGNQYILYDVDRIENIELFSFEPDDWLQHDALVGSEMGRGNTHIIKYDGIEYVLRHYQRGGQVSRLINDGYLWTGLSHTRAWREWYLLADMRHKGLPVPRPVAARVVRHGLYYRADIITERLMRAQTLAQYLNKAALDKSGWAGLGETLRRFHDDGVDHADLNAHNIMLDEEGRVYLIDFDKGRIRPSGTWKKGNLIRLLRSLRKLYSERVNFSFTDEDWDVLLKGYNSGVF